MGEDGREGERIKTWGSLAHQATEVPARICSEGVRGAGGGPCFDRTATSPLKKSLLSQYHILMYS